MTPPPKSYRAARDKLRQTMTDLDCSIGEIAAQMRQTFGDRPREAQRWARGWTLVRAAEAISQASGDAVGADATLLGKWEKWPLPGARRPTLRVLAAMAAAYGCSIEDLLDYNDRLNMPDGELQAIKGGRGAAPFEEPEANTSQPPPPLASVSDTVLGAADESVQWALWAESTNVGDIALEQIAADVRSLALDCLRGDSLACFGRARRLRDRTFSLLQGHQPPALTADLYVAAGYICSLLAWISSDLGNLTAADTQARTAWLCAKASENSELMAWVASTRSKIAFWGQRYPDAVEHARRGLAVRPRGSVGVLLACQEADAWSKLGATARAETALKLAHSAREGLGDEDDEIGGLFACTPARQLNYQAAVHLRTGRHAEALNETAEALRRAPQSTRALGTEAQIHISHATALAGLEEPEGVMAALTPIMDIPADQRSSPVLERARDLVDVMAGSSAAGSRGFIDARQALRDWRSDASRLARGLSPSQGRS